MDSKVAYLSLVSVNRMNMAVDIILEQVTSMTTASHHHGIRYVRLSSVLMDGYLQWT